MNLGLSPKREPGGGTVGELERRFVDAFQRAFRDESNAVNQRVASHAAIIQAKTTLVGRPFQGRRQGEPERLALRPDLHRVGTFTGAERRIR